MIGFEKEMLSVVICTYNPDIIVFSKVMDSIAALKCPEGVECEFVLIDNNSTFNLREIQSVNRFLERPDTRFVKELRQGHAFARMKGIEITSGQTVVFFDDDNEPPCNYLEMINKLFLQYPNVAVWGPGEVNVVFEGEVESWIHFNKGEFQDKKLGLRQYASVKDWLTCYPPGTGFAVRRQVLNSYLRKTKNGVYTDLGRTGSATASAEDVQIVFEAIKLGYAAGTDPDLQINHLIVARKAQFRYIKRLRFGMGSSFAKAYCECFPEDATVIGLYKFVEVFSLFWFAFYASIIKRKSPRFFAFESATVTGKIAGRYLKEKIPFPEWLRWLIKIQGLN